MMSKKTDFENMDRVLTNAFRLMVAVVALLFVIGGTVMMAFKEDKSKNNQAFEQNHQESYQPKE
jgi:hypothetical protein